MVWIIALIFILALLLLSGCKKPIKPESIITEVKLTVPYEKYAGYNSKGKYNAHAVCVFPCDGKYNVFSNKQYYTYKDNYISIGHMFYPKLKYMEIRDWQGKILSKRHKWIGTF